MSIIIPVAKSHPHLDVLFARLVALVPQSFVSLLQQAHHAIRSDCVVGGGVALENREGQCKVVLSLLVVVPLGNLTVIGNCGGLVVRGS